MKLSKKQSAHLSALINAVQVYNGMVSDEGNRPNRDNDKIQKAMQWADENIRALNEEFGTTLGGYKYNVRPQ